WLTGVDDSPRAGQVACLLAVRRNARIERAGRAVVEDRERRRRITARADSPQHVIGIARIDVLVDHHHEPAHVLAAGGQANAHGVARIALLDLHHCDARYRQPADIQHVLEAGPLQPVRLVALLSWQREMRRGASVAHRRHSQDDRIVAVIQRLHVNDRLGPGAGRVVAGPFSERTLVARFHSGRGNRSGDDDLGGRGYGQPGYFLADDLDRLTAHVADQVVLAHAQLLAEEWGCAG